MTTSKTATPIDPPIEGFAQCHIGILNKLDQLGELPALLAPAARAREIAEIALRFFHEAIFEHHRDEERELFPAVLDSAEAGAERDRVQALVDKLTFEHRVMETTWKRLEPGLKQVAKGEATHLNVVDIESLVAEYHRHAQLEETQFLPLSQAILGRNANHLAALGMSLHLRHSPNPVKTYI